MARCTSTWHKLYSSERREPWLGKCFHKIRMWANVHSILMRDWLRTLTSAHVSLHGLCVSSCFQVLSCLCSYPNFSDEQWYRRVSQKDSFFPKMLWSRCFITAVVTKTKWVKMLMWVVKLWNCSSKNKEITERYKHYESNQSRNEANNWQTRLR